MDFPLGI
jgi:hypothetical protein